MADANEWARAGQMLSGAAAGLMGEGPAYLEQVQTMQLKEEEARRKRELDRMQTVFTDSLTALGHAKAGEWDEVLKLGQERLESSRQFPEADFKDTKRLTELAAQAAAGSEAARTSLLGTLKRNVELGYEVGVLQRPPEARITPIGNRAYLRTQGGETTSHTIDWGPGQEPPEESHAGTTDVLKDVDTGKLYSGVSMTTDSGRHYYDITPIGHKEKPGPNLVKTGTYGEAGFERMGRDLDTERGKADIELDKQRSMVSILRDQSEGKKLGEVAAERLDGYIQNGIQAADGLTAAVRGLDLLDKVNTGGIPATAKIVTDFFGTTSADKGELNRILAQNVLDAFSYFKGSLAVAEGNWVKEIEANLKQGTAVNRALLKKAVSALQSNVNRGLRAAEKHDPIAYDLFRETLAQVPTSLRTASVARQVSPTPTPGSVTPTTAPSVPGVAQPVTIDDLLKKYPTGP